MDRDGLAALFARITRRLAAAEAPILATHGLSMWEYITLYRLAQRPAQAQAALAQAMGYDKTCRILDNLQHDGLIDQQPDPPTGAPTSSASPRKAPSATPPHLCARRAEDPAVPVLQLLAEIRERATRAA